MYSSTRCLYLQKCHSSVLSQNFVKNYSKEDVTSGNVCHMAHLRTQNDKLRIYLQLTNELNNNYVRCEILRVCRGLAVIMRQDR